MSEIRLDTPSRGRTPLTPPSQWPIRTGDLVVLAGGAEPIEGEVIATLAQSRYKVRWLTGPAFRDRITTVMASEIHKKT